MPDPDNVTSTNVTGEREQRAGVQDSQRQIGAHAQLHKVLNGRLTLDKVNQNLVQTGELITKNQSKLSDTDKKLFNEKYSACSSEFKKLLADPSMRCLNTLDPKILEDLNTRIDHLKAEINTYLIRSNPGQGLKR